MSGNTAKIDTTQITHFNTDFEMNVGTSLIFLNSFSKEMALSCIVDSVRVPAVTHFSTFYNGFALHLNNFNCGF